MTTAAETFMPFVARRSLPANLCEIVGCGDERRAIYPLCRRMCGKHTIQFLDAVFRGCGCGPKPCQWCARHIAAGRMVIPANKVHLQGRLEPMAIGIAAWGLVAGVAMAKSGLGVPLAIFMSIIVYAGSAQIAALPLIAAGAPVRMVALVELPQGDRARLVVGRVDHPSRPQRVVGDEQPARWMRPTRSATSTLRR